MSELAVIRNIDLAAVYALFDGLDVRRSTIRDYQYRIGYFIDFMRRQPHDSNLLLSYKRHLADNTELSVSTKNKYLITAKIFLRECYKHGYCKLDVSSGVKTFQQTKRHKVFGLNDYEVGRLCDWMNAHPDKLRERALLCLLLFQGFRQAEICELRVQDINLAERTMQVLGKGRDDRESVYMHDQTYAALKRYLATLQSLDHEYLFTSNSRTSIENKLTTRGLRYVVQGIFAKVGIERTVHGCRHYFATTLIRHMPGELLTVKRFTRHSGMAMLEVYNDELLDEQSVGRFQAAFSGVTKQMAVC